MPLTNKRDLRDALLLVSVALPTSAGTSTSTAIDLGRAAPGRGATDAELVIKSPAAIGVDAKTHTYSIEESADNVSFAAAAGLGSSVNTCASTTFPAYERRIKLQPTTLRYVRLKVVGNSGSGDSSATSTELSLRF